MPGSYQCFTILSERVWAFLVFPFSETACKKRGIIFSFNCRKSGGLGASKFYAINFKFYYYFDVFIVTLSVMIFFFPDSVLGIYFSVFPMLPFFLFIATKLFCYYFNLSWPIVIYYSPFLLIVNLWFPIFLDLCYFSCLFYKTVVLLIIPNRDVYLTLLFILTFLFMISFLQLYFLFTLKNLFYISLVACLIP